jgi:signal transduction histidine kinase
MEAFSQYYQARSLILLCFLGVLSNTFSFVSSSFTSPVPLDMMFRLLSSASIACVIRHQPFSVSTLMTGLFVMSSVLLLSLVMTDTETSSSALLQRLCEYSTTPILSYYMIRGRTGVAFAFLMLVLYSINLSNLLSALSPVAEADKIPLVVYGTGVQLFPLWILFSFESEMKTYHTLLEKFLDLSEERSKEKTHFISRMSHELRTPLHGLLSSVNLIKNTKISQEQMTFLSVIDSCGEAVLDVITKIVDIIKIESGDLENVISNFSLFEVTKSISQSLMSRIDEKGLNLCIDFDLHANGFDVKGDKNHLREVLLNVRCFSFSSGSYYFL